MKEGKNSHYWNTYKGDKKNLVQVIRRQKHKSKRTHARHYNFERDWLI